jgi:nitronate monooxygenase
MHKGGGDMWPDTPFTRRTGARLPIVAAPMAGGPSTPPLVAAAAAAGAYGVLPGGYTTPDRFRAAIREVRARTSAPFGVNLLLPQAYEVDEQEIQAALHLLRPYADELGVDLTVPDAFGDDVDGLLDVAIDERVGFLSFTFGIPSADRLDALRAASILTCGTATSVAEGRVLTDAGVDMVCVQGGEAGGHRGGFIGDPARGLVSLIALVPLVRDAVDVPVIAAGGISDGRGVAAALALGADAAQLGTAFLLCPEAGTSAPYRAAVAAATEVDTMLTSAFSGKPARGVRNRFTEELATVKLPPYPVMHALTRPLRQAAAAAGRSEFLSLWAGQGVPAVRELPAADLVALLARQTSEALVRLQSGRGDL